MSNLSPSDMKQKHQRILNRIFRNVTQHDQQKLQRRSEKNRIEKEFREEILGIMSPSQSLGDKVMHQQISSILTQLTDIASISKFHDEHFQLGKHQQLTMLTAPAQQSNRSHISFRLAKSSKQQPPSRKRSQIASMSHLPSVGSSVQLNSKPVSKTNIQEVDEKVQLSSLKTMKVLPTMTREQLYEVLKKHHQMASSETFSFKRFQKEFQDFWDKRMQSLSLDDRAILNRLQNKDEEPTPLPDVTDPSKIMDQLQHRLKKEFESMKSAPRTVDGAQQLKIQQMLAMNRKRGESKPLLLIRSELFIKERQNYLQGQKHKEEEEAVELDLPAPVPIRRRVIELPDKESSIDLGTQELYPKPNVLPSRKSTFFKPRSTPQSMETFFDKAKEIIDPENIHYRSVDGGVLGEKIEKLFKISINDLIDEMSQSRVRKRQHRQPLMSEHQRKMKKCEEILDRRDNHMPMATYDDMKSRLKVIRSSHSKRGSIY